MFTVQMVHRGYKWERGTLQTFFSAFIKAVIDCWLNPGSYCRVIHDNRVVLISHYNKTDGAVGVTYDAYPEEDEDAGQWVSVNRNPDGKYSVILE